MADPTMDAYLKALGFDDQSNLAWQQAGQQQQMVQQRYDIGIPELMRSTAQAQQGVQADALGRGIFSSGERARNLSNVNVGAQQQLARMNLSRDQGMQSIAMDLARQIADITRGRNQAVWNWNEYERSKAERDRALMIEQARYDAIANAQLQAQQSISDFYSGLIPPGFGGDAVASAQAAYQDPYRVR